MSIKKNIAYNTILNISNIVFPAVTTPYISRVLGVTNVGIVNYSITFATYFVLFAALGIPKYGLREIAKYNNDENGRNKCFFEIFIINIFSTVFFSIIYILLINTVPKLNTHRVFLAITGFLLFLGPLNTDWFFSGREKFKIIAIRSIMAKFLAIIALFVFVHTKQDAVRYLVLYVASTIISQIWNFIYLLKNEIKIKHQVLKLKKHLMPIVLLFASNVAISIFTSLNTIILGFISEYSEVGYFTSADKISRLILPFIISISPVIVARINTLRGLDGNNGKQILSLLDYSFELTIIFAVPASIGLFAIAPRFVPMFFGKEFIPSIVPLQILSLLIVIIGISNLFGIQVLLAMGYDFNLFMSVALGAVTSLVLSFALIPKLGSIGASVSSIVSELVVALATIIYSIKLIDIKIHLSYFIKPLTASLPIIFIAYFMNLIIKNGIVFIGATIILSVVLYLFVMIVIFKNRFLKECEIGIIKNVSKHLWKNKNI
ncbi:MAG: flippase [Bacteroidales bacterium]|jgi:O-antigen/teichoic acid export membrane protein|nr:flippase [Bacteroidales bacterium]